jgi:DNA replication protein DnaC
MSQVTTEQPGLRTLRLVAPHRRLLPNLPRSIEQVTPALRKIFADLAFARRPWPLFLYGPVGLGKTLAALCLCDRAASAAYFTAEGLCSATLESEPAAARELWNTIETKDLVVIDELGTRSNVTDFAYSTLKRAVDARDQHAQRAAVYISNLRPNELAALYDDRLASRVLCGTRLELTGADRRFA